MNIFEQLKEKKTPKNVKQFALYIKENNDEEKVDDEAKNNDEEQENDEAKDDNEENAENEDPQEKPQMPKHVLEFIDKRHENHIDRFLVLQRLKNYKEKPNEFNSNIPPILTPVLKDTEILEENTLKDLPTAEEAPTDGEHSLVRKEGNKVIIKKKGKIKTALPTIKEDTIVIPDIPNEDLSMVPEEPPKTVRITRSRARKSAIVLPLPKVMLDIENIDKKLPRKRNKLVYKSSSYYLNNRKLFIEKIDHLLHNYDDEIKDAEEVSCETRNNNSEFNLLTHQKVVRDYINLITPYRGLLILHGLGSGKTCTSIAIAEGMKTDKKIVLMTPASLKKNYFSELKKCGDPLFRKNQYWEFVSIEGQPNYTDVLSRALSLPKDYIEKYNGAWLVDVNKSPNYASLNASYQKLIDDQLDQMIRNKYQDINYDGLNTNILSRLTKANSINPFDNSVVVIDEAHNFVSRIVNKLKVKDTNSISCKLYEYLMSATNAKVILLTGTPIINYSNEIGVLYNILRGYIKTWNIPVTINTKKKINKDEITDILNKENFDFYDYIDYTGNKITITRNPFGFINVKNRRGTYMGVTLDETGNISDDVFYRNLISILKKHDIEVNTSGVQIVNHKCLPDEADKFNEIFINSEEMMVKNHNLLQRRILGLTSYFKSAQENLLPSFVETPSGEKFHIVSCEMSDYQFTLYEKIRKDEADKEKRLRKRRQRVKTEDIFNLASSYRIFSRACCNFAFPDPPGRPMPGPVKRNDDDENADKEDNVDKEDEPEINENDLDAMDDVNSDYVKKIENALNHLKTNADDYLIPDKLSKYSPKFLEILSNIKSTDHEGLHMIYSNFVRLEGIGILKLVLEANGFAQFKIKKSGSIWVLDEAEEDVDKPKFILYTGNETAEEKEYMLNIYNSKWDPESVPSSITNELRKKYENNFFGEVIKIIMISPAGSEGINLKNTRYVHIVDPYWHMVRIDQVIGRARRICSHEDLPEEYRNIQVFLYMSTLSEDQVSSESNMELKIRDVSKIDKNVILSTDESLFEISRIKNNINDQILKYMKESSVDCSLYASSDNLVCFNYGKVKSNQFGSVPSISEDKFQKDETHVQTRKFQKFYEDDVEYVLDKKTNEVFTIESYNRLMKNPRARFNPIGILEKKGRKYVINRK